MFSFVEVPSGVSPEEFDPPVQGFLCLRAAMNVRVLSAAFYQSLNDIEMFLSCAMNATNPFYQMA